MDTNGHYDKDPLGTRIKENYENRTRYMLPRRTYTIIRLDGKSFHTYTKGLKKPFDKELFEDIDAAIIATLPEIQGAVFAYTQSDEISILLTDFATPQTDAWFDGNLQKMCSVAASILTAQFNRIRLKRFLKINLSNAQYPITKKYMMDDFVNQDIEYFVKPAYFDSRVFTIPDRIEVMNYLLWRNQDCCRNSLSMVAQANFSPKELHGKSSPEMHEMLHTKGVNWSTDYADGEKNGRIIYKVEYKTPLKDFNEDRPDDEKLIGLGNDGLLHDYIKRSRWVAKGAWKFTEDKEKLLGMIPKYE